MLRISTWISFTSFVASTTWQQTWKASLRKPPRNHEGSILCGKHSNQEAEIVTQTTRHCKFPSPRRKLVQTGTPFSPPSPFRLPGFVRSQIEIFGCVRNKLGSVIARTRGNSIPVLVWQRDFIPRLRPTWLTWSYLFQSVTYQKETSWNELLFVVSLITVRIFVHRNQNYLDPAQRPDSCN